MKYIYIGKIVNTHGIKGELRILSEFEYKNLIFNPGTNLYIGKGYEKHTINTYRPHKNYDMVTLDNYNNINDVLKFKGDNVYIIKEEIPELNSIILNEDIIGMKAYISDEYIGNVVDIYNTGVNYKVIEVYNGLNNKKTLIPYHRDFIDNINLTDKSIKFKGGML